MLRVTFLMFFVGYWGLVSGSDAIYSVRSMTHRDGRMYVNASDLLIQESQSEKLLELWQSAPASQFVDSYGQAWKQLSLSKLSELQGTSARHFIVITKNEAKASTVDQFMLFQWGCEGSIIPVVSLGNWPFGWKPWEYEGLAFEVNPRLGVPMIQSRSYESLHELNIPLDKEQVIRVREMLWQDLTNERVFIVDLALLTHNDEQVIIFDMLKRKHRVVEAREIFDSRC